MQNERSPYMEYCKMANEEIEKIHHESFLEVIERIKQYFKLDINWNFDINCNFDINWNFEEFIDSTNKYTYYTIKGFNEYGEIYISTHPLYNYFFKYQHYDDEYPSIFYGPYNKKINCSQLYDDILNFTKDISCIFQKPIDHNI
jgi:hypothetical protein